MAEYSKQWAELYDPEFPWDFDIEKIAKDLIKGNHYPIICEGLGIVGIAKNKEGKTLLAVPIKRENSNEFEWKDYEEFMLFEKRKYLSENQD